jgi:hypothetical protein
VRRELYNSPQTYRENATSEVSERSKNSMSAWDNNRDSLSQSL